MSKCLFCKKEAGFDKRNRMRKCCNMTCVIKYSAKNRKMKEKQCVNCNNPFTPKHRSTTRFCSMNCKAYFMWHNGKCKVPSEKAIKNLIPCQRKDKVQKSNPYIRKVIQGKQQRLHRFLMEEHIGRKLKKCEHVHHINENQTDNRIENLKIVTPSEHGRIHLSKKQ